MFFFSVNYSRTISFYSTKILVFGKEVFEPLVPLRSIEDY